MKKIIFLLFSFTLLGFIFIAAVNDQKSNEVQPNATELIQAYLDVGAPPQIFPGNVSVCIHSNSTGYFACSGYSGCTITYSGNATYEICVDGTYGGVHFHGTTTAYIPNPFGGVAVAMHETNNSCGNCPVGEKPTQK